MSDPLLLAHAASTLAMVGLIWFVQIVHYPLMAEVGTETYPIYQAGHVRRTSWVVVPFMLVELVTAAGLCLHPTPEVPLGEAVCGLLLLGGVWASTFALQVPLHASLERAFGASAHGRLVRTNWIRTILWSARGAGVILWLSRALS